MQIVIKMDPSSKKKFFAGKSHGKKLNASGFESRLMDIHVNMKKNPRVDLIQRHILINIMIQNYSFC